MKAMKAMNSTNIFCSNFEKIKSRVLLTISVCPVVVMEVIPIRLGINGTPMDFECDRKLKLVSFKKEVLMALLQKNSVSSQMLDDFEFFMRVSYDMDDGIRGMQYKTMKLEKKDHMKNFGTLLRNCFYNPLSIHIQMSEDMTKENLVKHLVDAVKMTNYQDTTTMNNLSIDWLLLIGGHFDTNIFQTVLRERRMRRGGEEEDEEEEDEPVENEDMEKNNQGEEEEPVENEDTEKNNKDIIIKRNRDDREPIIMNINVVEKTVKDLMEQIEVEHGIPINTYNLYFQEVVPKKMEDFRRVDEYISKHAIDEADRSVIIMPKPLGGGLIRKHKSKHESIALLKAKAHAFATHQDEEFDVNIMPEEIRTFIQNQNDKMDQVKLLVGDGRDVIKLALSNVQQDKLITMKDLMEKRQGGKFDTSERRVASLVAFLFPTVDLVSTVSKSLASVHGKMISYFMSIYIDRFHQLRGDETTYDHKKFIQMISDEQTRRANLAEAGVNAVPSDASRNCIIS